MNDSDLMVADDFVQQQLSLILHGVKDYYPALKKIKSKDLAFHKFKFRGVPYFIDYGGQLLSQYSMSTGECLLISLLHFLNVTVIRNRDQVSAKFIIIDEVELALHPSALKRLIDLLDELSQKHNLVIYFSTHSIELVRYISPSRIFFLQRGIHGDISVINPCFPAYATRSLFDHDGYDFLILVEDELAKYIVKKIIEENDLLESRLVHVLPCAGWENTLALHADIVNSKLVGIGRTVLSVLDGDIENECKEKFIRRGIYNNLNVRFLPIKSVEKYLFDKLWVNADSKFTKKFGDKFFQIRSLLDILQDFKNNFPVKKQLPKNLWGLIRACAEEQNLREKEFLTKVSEFIYEIENFDELGSKLAKAIS